MNKIDEDRDLAHEADMEELRREQLAADVGDSDDEDEDVFDYEERPDYYNDDGSFADE